MLYFAYGSNLNHDQMKKRCKDSQYVDQIFLNEYELILKPDHGTKNFT